MKKNSVGLLVSITITFLAAQLHADTFYTTVNQTAGNSPNWNSAIWTNTTVTVAAAPSAGNDYVFGGFATVKVLRSPYATSTQPFNGDSLRLDPNGTLRLKSTAAPTASIYTFGTGGLKLNGGYVGNGDDQRATINSPLTVMSASAIYAGQDPTTVNSAAGTHNGFRNYIFNGTLSGSGNLTLGNALMYNNSQISIPNQTAIGTTANFAFNGDGSLYSGLLTVTAGWLQAGSANAFGNANITIAGGNAINGVGGPAQFNATVDFASAGTLTISDVNNTLSLDNNLTFSDAFIDGFDLLTALGAGSWNASQINGATGQGNVFGPALLTIGSVPEPSSISLAIMGGLGLMMFCRRRRS